MVKVEARAVRTVRVTAAAKAKIAIVLFMLYFLRMSACALGRGGPQAYSESSYGPSLLGISSSMAALKNISVALLMLAVAVCVTEPALRSVANVGSSAPKLTDPFAIGDEPKPSARSRAP